MVPTMTEEPGGPETRPRRWRWALPVGAAVLVAGVVVGVVVAAPHKDGVPAQSSPKSPAQPRFAVSADNWGGASGNAAWFQVHDMSGSGKDQVVDAVAPPSANAGAVTSIVAGPDKMFVLAAWHVETCETSLYRFTLTDDGHAKDLTPVTRTQALAGGLAISPDGRRIAYATGGCGTNPEQSPPAEAPISLTVLDIETEQHRTWTASRPSVVGEIVWAGDNRTLGYTTAEILPGNTVGLVELRATDTEDPDTELLSGRVLFTQPDLADTVSTAVMNTDGRTGFGVLHREQPPSTILFTFSEGQPIKVTQTIPEKPNSATMMSVSDGSGPRYACFGGVDAFGRVNEQKLRASTDTGVCGTAYWPS
jgi:hypothetical protein